MKKYIVIDNRMRDIHKKYLESLGYFLIEIPKNSNTYEEISSHVDIFCAKINNKVVFEKNIYSYFINSEKYRKIFMNKNIFCGNKKIDLKYPDDISYNVCIMGKNAVHNFKYTDENIVKILGEECFNSINVSQGYTKCSVAVIDENSCITCDVGIAKLLQENGIDVLLIEEKLDIHLLKENKYSDMIGFIGGSIVRLENKIIVFGDLEYIDKDNKIREYILSKNLEIVDFKGLDVIDYGSIVSFEGEDING
jgi:hypothetical protein